MQVTSYQTKKTPLKQLIQIEAIEKLTREICGLRENEWV